MIASLVRRIVGIRPPAEYSLRELVGLFAAMREAGLEALPVERFCRRLTRGKKGGPGPGSKGYGLLRFDIHGNFDRPLRVAERLSALGMHGLFLTMHRHTVNEPVYDARTTWDTLKKIQDLGHEIGLHFDPFYLIRAHGDLYSGIGAAVAELARRGFTVQAASVHGDSRAHIKECGLQANDFFSEGHRPSRWTGRPPRSEEFLADHVKRYSQEKIAETTGILYFVEPTFSHLGALVSEQGPAYLSDNRRELRINNLPANLGDDGVLTAPEPLRISPAFAQEAAAALTARPFLALFHPQWYA